MVLGASRGRVAGHTLQLHLHFKEMHINRRFAFALPSLQVEAKAICRPPEYRWRRASGHEHGVMQAHSRLGSRPTMTRNRAQRTGPVLVQYNIHQPTALMVLSLAAALPGGAPFGLLPRRAGAAAAGWGEARKAGAAVPPVRTPPPLRGPGQAPLPCPYPAVDGDPLAIFTSGVCG